jgi:hypothetical protein
LEQPDLRAIGNAHFPGEAALIEAAWSTAQEFQSARGLGRALSAAEFLDFVLACKHLNVQPGSEAWANLAEICAFKTAAPTEPLTAMRS